MLTVLLILVGISIGLIALLVVMRGRQLPNLLFFGTSACMSIWAFSIARFRLTSDSLEALVLAKTFYVVTVLFGTLLYFLVRVFPTGGKISSRSIMALGSTTLLLVALIIFIPTFITSEVVLNETGNKINLDPVSYAIFSVYFSLVFYLGILHAFKRYRHKKGLVRSQIAIYAFALFTMSVPGVVANLILPSLGNYSYIWVGPVAALLFVISTAYSIVRHKLFNFRLVIARSLAYLLLVGTLAVGYAAVIFGGFSHIPSFSPVSFFQQTVYLVSALFVAITFQPLKRFFDRLTNKLFYRDAYDAQNFIDQLNKVLVTSVDIDLLLREAIKVIDYNLKSAFTAITLRETSYLPRRFVGTHDFTFDNEEIEIIKNATKQSHQRVILADDIHESDPRLYRLLQKYDIAVLARLVTTLDYDVEGIGYLLIGNKKSGNPYSRQDTNVIRIIASELVIAIQNSLRFEEISEFNLTLQEKVDTATRKLQKSNEKLVALDETKDEFISMASHQLRTPLTSVKGYISMVLEGDAGELNEMQKKLLEQSFISSQRMVYLIADLLNLSRLRTGKFVIERAPTNLAEVVEGEITQLMDTATGRNLKLTYKKPKEFTPIMLDETKIRQVIMNFTDNAIYYTPAGGKIEVALKETDKTIEFTVTDNGIGVPKSEQHHLFNKFYRAGNAKKARPDGTGLGLFMAKKVIIAQGGALIFHTKEGKGSTFGFSFAKDKLKVPEKLTPAK